MYGKSSPSSEIGITGLFRQIVLRRSGCNDQSGGFVDVDGEADGDDVGTKLQQSGTWESSRGGAQWRESKEESQGNIEGRESDGEGEAPWEQERGRGTF